MSKDLYLLCQYVQKPKQGVNTAQKGFGSNPDNWQFDEVVTVSRGLKTRDYRYQNVILNMSKKRIERNSMNPDATWEDIYEYFKEHYKEYITTIENEIERDQQATS
jgi:hypothetical protein